MTLRISSSSPVPRRRTEASRADRNRRLLRRLLRENLSLLRELEDLRILKELSEQDPLTGLPTARSWRHRLDAELLRTDPKWGGVPCSVVIVQINDLDALTGATESAADCALVADVGEVLQGVLRAADACCRSGSGEFLLLFTDTNTEAARTAIAKVHSAIMREGARRDLPLSVSVGAATSASDVGTSASMIAIARRALAADKRRQAVLGRHRRKRKGVQLAVIRSKPDPT